MIRRSPILLSLVLSFAPPLGAAAATSSQPPKTVNAEVAALRASPNITEPADADPALTPADYLSAADRLTLRFRGYQELTGDYRVNPDHTISVPAIGRISISGLDLAGLEKVLSTKLSQMVQKESFVTAEVAAYRPVFVMGAVRNPGAIEWRPGLAALQAIALVGGLAATNIPSAVSGSDNGVAVNKAVDNLKRDLATVARLRTARSEASDIPVPPQLVRLVGSLEANTLIARETVILKDDRESLDAKLATLNEGIQFGTTEIESLRRQIESLNGQLRARSDYAAKVKGLFAQGIITAERNLQEEIKVTDLQEKITNINVGLARSAGTVAQLQMTAVSLKRDRMNLIDADLARAERDSAQLAIEIGSARGTVPTLLQPDKGESGDEPETALQIKRMQNDTSTTVNANQGTLMRPGDVLIVGRQ